MCYNYQSRNQENMSWYHMCLQTGVEKNQPINQLEIQWLLSYVVPSNVLLVLVQAILSYRKVDSAALEEKSK